MKNTIKVNVRKAEMNGMDISFIRNFIYNTLRNEGYSPNALLDNGAIYYMNGNDGTDFDYYANHRTCEFCVFRKDKSVLLSAQVEEDKIHAFVFPGKKDSKKMYEYESEYAGDLRELCDELWKNFDYFRKYNEVVKFWKLRKIFACTFDVDMQIGEQISFKANHFFCATNKTHWDRYVDFAKQNFGTFPMAIIDDKVLSDAQSLAIYVARQMAEKMVDDAAFRADVLNYLASKRDITEWLGENNDAFDYENLLLYCHDDITFVGLSNIKENADMIEPNVE